jgi:alkylhydroperoxidase family enzyme
VDDPLAVGLALLPDVGERWTEFEATVWSGALGPVLLELCRVRVATLLRDDVGSSLRTPAAVSAGVTDDLLEALPNWPVSSRFGQRERAALAFTELFVIEPHSVTDGMCAELLATVTAAEATALTMAVALFDATSRSRVARARAG